MRFTFAKKNTLFNRQRAGRPARGRRPTSQKSPEIINEFKHSCKVPLFSG
jgi:hypothetical protein